MSKICIVAIDVRSAYNIGSIIRTADGFGSDVVLCGISPYPNLKQDYRLPHVSKKAHQAISKTALGAEESVDIKYFENFIEAFDMLKKAKYTLIAIEQDISSSDLSDYVFNNNNKYALIVGSEVEGLPKKILDLCDDICEIKMIGKKESFNVSIASGIALYQAYNKLVVK